MTPVIILMKMIQTTIRMINKVAGMDHAVVTNGDLGVSGAHAMTTFLKAHMHDVDLVPGTNNWGVGLVIRKPNMNMITIAKILAQVCINLIF